MAKQPSKGPNKKHFQHNVDDDGSFTREQAAMTPEERRADFEAYKRDLEKREAARQDLTVPDPDDPVEYEGLGPEYPEGGGSGASHTHMRPGPSEKQLAFLRDLGHTGPAPKTKAGASDLIDELLAKKSEAPRTDIPPGTMPNRFPGKCRKCGGQVEPQQGNVTKDSTGRWVAAHNDGGCVEQVVNKRTGTKHAATEPPEGIHLLDGVIYKVQVAVHGSGQLYAKVLTEPSYGTDYQAGVYDSKWTFEYLGRKGAFWKLSESTLMTLEQAKEFGKLYGMCCVCGATLTDERSIEAGIGPVCAGRSQF